VRVIALVVTGVVCSSVTARAESAADLQAEGEKAAKEGDYAGAIEKFKAADRIESRASHACLISLAYTRRNLWPQAEIFRTKCHERATPADPLPDWIGTADKQIDDAIAAANVAEVTISVEPAEAAANAQLTVSSFAPDEKFPPRAIHLPPGIHQIFASAPGFQDGHQLVDIKDKTPQKIVIRLLRPGETPPGEIQPVPAVQPASKLPWIVMGSGAAVAALGAVLHVTWYRSNLDAYQKALDMNPSLPHSAPVAQDWETSQRVVIGCYVVGGLAIGTGLVLKYTVFKNSESAPMVSFFPHAHGGMVSVGWSR